MSDTVVGRCGTYAGWNDHRRSGETPCSDCKAAFAAYQREWRKKSPAKYRRASALQAARMSAALLLALDYPAEFERRLREVKAERGLL